MNVIVFLEGSDGLLGICIVTTTHLQGAAYAFPAAVAFATAAACRSARRKPTRSVLPTPAGRRAPVGV